MESTNPKDKIGRKKPNLHLIPPAAVIEESVVMGLGADKYGPFNWREKSVAATVYVSAALRHIYQYLDGEDIDEESGASHLAHARACFGILLDAAATGNLVDDRPMPGAASDLIKKHTKTDEPKTEPVYFTTQHGVFRIDLPPMTLGEIFEIKPAKPFGGPLDIEIGPSIDPGVGLIEDLEVTDDDELVETGQEGTKTYTHEEVKEEFTPHFYIAGPMRGYPFYNFPAFDDARDLGKSLGYQITSPADIDREQGLDPINDWAGAIEHVDNWTQDDLRAVVARDVHAILVLKRDRGDGLAVLPGWEHSTGARAEVALAKWLGLQVVSALDFKTEVEI